MPIRVDITGHAYGRWSVIGRAHNVGRFTAWNCVCECGTRRVVTTNSLRSGNSKSCGCLSSEKTSQLMRKHFAKGTPEYNSWVLMRDRCNNPNNKTYSYYGGKGIAVCREWHDFEVFLADMGKKPHKSYTLDRIDPNGNYEPNNCRWASKKRQSRNRTDNRLITIGGITKHAADWAEEYNIPYKVVYKRLWRGWDGEKALTQKIGG